MKRVFISFVLSVMSVWVSAQSEVEVKAGTIIPLQIVNSVKAADVKVGQKVSFRVSRDVNVGGLIAIPYGTPVSGIVYQAKRSSWWGTKGRLGIKIDEIIAPDGVSVPLTNGDVYVTGTNRTPLTVVLFCVCLWPGCFICGSKAEIQTGYEIHANVASNTVVTVR